MITNNNLESQIINTKGAIDRDILFEYILSLDMIRVCNGQIYCYIETKGYWKQLPLAQVNLLIRSNLSVVVNHALPASILKNVVSDIKEQPDININFDNYRNEDVLNLNDGVLNIGTLKVEEHRKENYFTYFLNFSFIKEAELEKAKTFKGFLESSLDYSKKTPDKAELLLQMIAYTISEMSGAKCAMAIIGKPHCGKSAILKLLELVVGEDFFTCLSWHEMVDRFKLSRMVGKRVNITHEIRNKAFKGIDIIKKLISQERLLVERKGFDAFEHVPRTKLLIAGNYLPYLAEQDENESFSTRLVVLLFTKTIPRDKWNTKLHEDMFQEANIIMSLAVKKLAALQNRNFEFSMPKESIAFIDNYNQEQNSTKLFVNDCCILDVNAKIHHERLYESYFAYCKTNLLQALNKNQFKACLDGSGNLRKEKFRLDGSVSLWGYVGIGLKNR